MKKPAPVDLAAMRHTAAHVLAAASAQLRADTKLGVGPAIDDGFYHDIDVAERYSEDDLKKLQAEMEKIKKQDLPITQREVSKEEAKQLFANDPYKFEFIDELPGDTVGISDMGNGFFVTLCKGGHVYSTGQIGFFKLTRLAGVYWKGDATKPQLQRIYGVLFPTRKELDDYFTLQEEAKKRDHKVLGPKLGLFAFSPLVGPGLPLFLPRGTVIWNALDQLMREEKIKLGYKFVMIPHLAKAELYKKSGHLGKYDAIMPPMRDEEGSEYIIKPMNCPHHFEIYNAEPHSYRDLPLRLSSNTMVYRNEKSGELAGLVRIKSPTQDDTHHFVRHDQISTEIDMIFRLMDRIYSLFGFTGYRVQISVRGPQQPEKYFGDDALWTKSEQILIEAVKQWGKSYVIEAGEAAFYGPKIDVMVRDSLGREWQLTTVQLDFNQPENFKLRYTAEDGKEHAPAVLHVAILGSIERFMGILIEHYAGNFPLWLSPIQVAVLPISEEQNEYAQSIVDELKKSNIRVEVNSRSESVGKKIREAQTMKTPVMLIVGKKEVAAQQVSVRSRAKGDEGSKKLEEVGANLKKQIEERH